MKATYHAITTHRKCIVIDIATSMIRLKQSEHNISINECTVHPLCVESRESRAKVCLTDLVIVIMRETEESQDCTGGRWGGGATVSWAGRY